MARYFYNHLFPVLKTQYSNLKAFSCDIIIANIAKNHSKAVNLIHFYLYHFLLLQLAEILPTDENFIMVFRMMGEHKLDSVEFMEVGKLT